MKVKTVLVIASLLPTLSATIAAAFLPLQNPPFTAGGYVPIRSPVLRSQVTTAAFLAKYLTAKANCDRRLLRTLHAGYSTANTTQIESGITQWEECTAGVTAKLYVRAGRQADRHEDPWCLWDASCVDPAKARLDSALALMRPAVFCDASLGTDPSSGFAIPTQREIAHAEVTVLAAAVRASSDVSRCFAKSVIADFDGMVDVDKHEACVQTARARALGIVDRFASRSQLPTCLSPAAATGVVEDGLAAGGSSTDLIYCGSMTPAFLDGVSTF